jgi:hypothetical protein
MSLVTDEPTTVAPAGKVTLVEGVDDPVRAPAHIALGETLRSGFQVRRWQRLPLISLQGQHVGVGSHW